MTKLAIGVDIGGTLTKVGLVDREGHLLCHSDYRTKNFPDLDEYLDELMKHVNQQCDSVNDPIEIVGMGIGAPNANF